MLAPKRAKFRKSFRGKRRGAATRGAVLNFGEFGLKSLSNGWVSGRQIEAARKALTHFTKRGGRVWIRVFPDKPVSKKPAETRMGGGKGDIADYVAVVKAGRIIFEMGAISHTMAKEAFVRAAAKLPVKTKFITKQDL